LGQLGVLFFFLLGGLFSALNFGVDQFVFFTLITGIKIEIFFSNENPKKKNKRSY
jgi:hypothetical protein